MSPVSNLRAARAAGAFALLLGGACGGGAPRDVPAPASQPAPAAPVAAGEARAAALDSSGPSDARRGLVFLWRDADSENRFDATAATEVLEPQGLAWTDRHRALALGGGAFSAVAGTGRRIAAASGGQRDWTLGLLVTTASLDEHGPIVAFSDGPEGRNFVLRQERDRLLLQRGRSEDAAIDLGRLPSTSPHAVHLRCASGRWTLDIDGAPAGDGALPATEADPWQPRALTFGAEEKSAERWHGTLAEIALWNRALPAPEIADESARLAQKLASRPAIPRLVVDVRLRDSSPAPTLDEIAPYREALAVDEYALLRQVSGEPLAGEVLRVVRWAILDDRPLAAASAGETRRLVLEPFAAQPQLESFFLADRLPERPRSPLYFDLGLTAAP